jgi:hypothetical protein
MFLQRPARTSGSASTIPTDRISLPLIALLAVSLFSPASSPFSLSHLVPRCPYLSPRLLSCPPVSTALSPVSPALSPIQSPVLLDELPALLLISPVSLPPPCLTCLPAQTLISMLISPAHLSHPDTCLICPNAHLACHYARFDCPGTRLASILVCPNTHHACPDDIWI